MCACVYMWVCVYICMCIYIYIYIYTYWYWPIGLVGRVFANGLRDRSSITGQVIAKTQKMVLAALLNTHNYKVWIKGKVEQFSATPWCSSKWKGSLQIALDYSRQFYLYIYIYIYTHIIIYVCVYIYIYIY